MTGITPRPELPSKHFEKTERFARVGEVTSPIGSPYISPSEGSSPAKRFSLSGEVIFSLSVPSPRGGISPAKRFFLSGEVIFSLSVPSPGTDHLSGQGKSFHRRDTGPPANDL